MCRLSSGSAASWLRCLLPWVMVWVLSGVGAVWGCVRVLYLWEPVTALHSPKSVSFWRHRKQADLQLNRVSADEPRVLKEPSKTNQEGNYDLFFLIQGFSSQKS